MEVHHHPNTEKKGFKEYFLEFLMIFLAVTLGFFAESYREHVSNHSREKEYITSMVEDLKADADFLTLSLTKLIPYHITWLDSTVRLLQAPDLKGKDREVYQAFYVGTAWTYNFYPTQRTLSQLHSEGFHLVRNKNAAGIISQLEDQYKIYSQITTFVYNMQNDIDLSAYTFADRFVTDTIGTITFKEFHNNFSVHLELSDIPGSAKINTGDKEAIKLYVDKIKKYSFYVQTNVRNEYNILLNQINKTIHILKTEYHLE